MDESGPSTSGFSTPFTRSRTSPLGRERCVFCQKDDGEQLYKVRTVNAGNSLKEAVEKSSYDTLTTRMNTCIAWMHIKLTSGTIKPVGQNMFSLYSDIPAPVVAE